MCVHACVYICMFVFFHEFEEWEHVELFCWVIKTWGEHSNIDITLGYFIDIANIIGLYIYIFKPANIHFKVVAEK